MLENKKIRDKINSLDQLPETYHPNMASKWSLLEAGLNGNEKRRIMAWKRMAVTAVLVMMAGSAFVLFNYKETSLVSDNSSEIKSGMKLTELPPVPKMKEELKPVKKINRRKPLLAPVKEEVRIVGMPLKDSIVQPPAPRKEINMLTTNTLKAKKPRFIELDFNDNVDFDKPVEAVTASQQFRFKIGTDIVSDHKGNTREVKIRLQEF